MVSCFQHGSGSRYGFAGDVRVPAVLFFVCSWGVFVPLAHALSFAPGQGWVDLLPQFGYGALGGWSTSTIRRLPVDSSDTNLSR